LSSYSRHGTNNSSVAGPGPSSAQANKSFEELKRHIHIKFVENPDLSRVLDLDFPGDTLRREIRLVLESAWDPENPMRSRMERERLIDEVLDETFGFGPLEMLLKDPTISEIMVNGPAEVHVERGGKVEKSDIKFRDHEHLLHIIQRIASKVGRPFGEMS